MSVNSTSAVMTEVIVVTCLWKVNSNNACIKSKANNTSMDLEMCLLGLGCQHSVTVFITEEIFTFWVSSHTTNCIFSLSFPLIKFKKEKIEETGEGKTLILYTVYTVAATVYSNLSDNMSSLFLQHKKLNDLFISKWKVFIIVVHYEWNNTLWAVLSVLQYHKVQILECVL